MLSVRPLDVDSMSMPGRWGAFDFMSWLARWLVWDKEKDARSGGYARRGGLTFQALIAFWVGISGNPGRFPGYTLISTLKDKTIR